MATTKAHPEGLSAKMRRLARERMREERSRAYKLGVDRGRATLREEPIDRDWDWLANETDGEIQTDPDDCNDFAYGMRDGARAAEA